VIKIILLYFYLKKSILKSDIKINFYIKLIDDILTLIEFA